MQTPSHVAVRQAVLLSLYEYLLLTLPVGVYVSLEALHKQSLPFFWSSPEWAIATIFLSFQALSLYWQNLRKTGHRVSEVFLGLLALGALVISIGASLNAYRALEHNSPQSVGIRVILFFLASAAFLLLVASARLANLIWHNRGSHVP